MRDRLIQVHELLAPDRSVWVHCDDSEQGRLRVLMDEIFGSWNFVVTIIWQKSYTRENREAVSTQHDYIHVYAIDRNAWKLVRNLLPQSDDQVARYSNPDNDPRGAWKGTPLHAQGGHGTAEQFYSITTPAGRTVNPPPGNCWRYTWPRYEELLSDKRIWFGRDGKGVPTLKKFLSEVQLGLVPVSLWPHQDVGTTGEAKQEVVAIVPDEAPFSTPKPERLLQRIIHIASDPGDVVLDPFVGSGTTAAVAHKMGRRWIAIEREAATIRQFARPRLDKVTRGEDPGGVTGLTGWQGGGGFGVLEIAPSMFEVDGGMVFLAHSLTDGRLAEATAAQLGFNYEVAPPFVGRKGRARLAVIDGVANEGVVRLLVSALNERERVVVCGTGIDTEARRVLRDLRPGSTLRKIPAALLDEYRSARQLALDLTTPEPVAEPEAVGAAG